VGDKCLKNGLEITICPTSFTLSDGACYTEGTRIFTCPENYELEGDVCIGIADLLEVEPEIVFVKEKVFVDRYIQTTSDKVVGRFDYKPAIIFLLVIVGALIFNNRKKLKRYFK